VKKPGIRKASHQLRALSYESGHYADAVEKEEKALEIEGGLQLVGGDDAGLSLNNLALSLFELGRLSEAEPLLLQAIAIERKSPTARYPDLAEALSNLAVLETTGRLDAARRYAMEALEIIQSYGGDKDPRMAIVWTDLGSIEAARNNLQEARRLHEKAADLWLKTLGPGNPKYEAALSNVGSVERKQGHHKKALYQRALQIDEARFGRNHPKVATDLCNLAVELFSLNKYDGALSLFERAKSMHEKAYGPESVQVAQTWRDMGATYRSAKQLEQASLAYDKAIRSFESSSGKDNPRLSTWLQEYADVLKKQQRFADAERAVTRAVGIQVRNTIRSASIGNKGQVRPRKKSADNS
jgi:tetratricopeptide (TPR) repeat protein